MSQIFAVSVHVLVQNAEARLKLSTILWREYCICAFLTRPQLIYLSVDFDHIVLVPSIIIRFLGSRLIRLQLVNYDSKDYNCC